MNGRGDARSACLKEIAEEIERVTSKLRGVQADLRRCKKNNAKKTTRQRESGLWSTLASLMMLTGGDVQVLAQYLRVQGVDPTERDELLPELTAWHSRVTETRDRFVARASEDLKLRPSLERAEVFLEENKLDSWITEQNVSKGLTPSSHAVLTQLRRQDTKNLTRHIPQDVSKNKKSSFQWLRRWRRRWSVSLQTLPIGEHMPASEKAAKVAQPQKRMLALNVDKGETELGRNWGHFLDPILGTSCSF